MLLQIVEAENACIAAQNLGAGDSPDQLGGGVEMADKAITVDDDHGIVRPLKRSQQELGTFDRWAIAGAHCATLGLAGWPSSLDIEGSHDLGGEHIAAAMFRMFVRSGSTWRD
jgi:hypothetical protein